MTELLGRTVRDVVSEMVGIADTYVEMLAGSQQYGLAPPGDGKTNPDGAAFDVQRLSVVEDGATLTADPADDTVIVELGDKVRSLISGAEGIATRKITFINGCVYFDVSGHMEKPIKKGDPGVMFTSHTSLEIIEKGYFQRIARESREKPPARPAAAPLPAAAPAARPPGGPVGRADRIS